MLAAIAAALSAPQAPPPLAPVAPTEAAATAADPAFAGDGRLAVSARGDLWVLAGGEAGHWIRITSGPASDRQPAWTPDGSALVFTSDRSGTFDLWRVGVGPAGATGEPERLTSAPEWEGEPTVGPVGDIVFVGNEDDGVSFGMQASEEVQDLLTCRGIQIPGGFIGKNDGWGIHQRARDRDALTLASAELVRTVPGVFGKFHDLEEFRNGAKVDAEKAEAEAKERRREQRRGFRKGSVEYELAQQLYAKSEGRL